MPLSPEYVTYCIGGIRRHHDLVRTLLHRACEEVAVYRSSGWISEVDVAVDRVRASLNKLSGVQPKDVARVLGEDAASALADIRSAIWEAEETFGLTAGPNRTEEQLSATAASITPLLYRARDRFNDWDKATRNVRIPKPTEMPPPIGELAPHVKPVRSVPAVPPRLPSEAVARSARSVLGTSFSMAAICWGKIAGMKGDDRKFSGVAAIVDFGTIMAQLSARSSGLGRRASSDDAPFVEMVDIAADEASRFYRLATEKLTNPTVGHFDFVVADCEHTVKVFGRLVQNADKLIAKRGLSFEVAEPEMSSPTP